MSTFVKLLMTGIPFWYSGCDEHGLTPQMGMSMLDMGAAVLGVHCSLRLIKLLFTFIISPFNKLMAVRQKGLFFTESK